MDNENIKYKVAVDSSDGIVINQHFGRAALFGIYDVLSNNTIHLVETREVIPVCQAGNHDDDRMRENIRHLLDCKYVLVSRIGQGAAALLEQEGIIPMELPGLIGESVQKLMVYEEIQNLLA
jgi:predicted Fe-Mo cluster-binding NifX family protein